ncbi:MAG: lysylphosphatidylglycerol synthase transmembrane domain-containing protein [Elusimicrobiota bacterium]
MKRFRRRASILLAVAVGAGLFYFAFRDVRFGDLLRTLGGFRKAWLPVLIAIPVLDVWIRAVRWRLLLRPVVEARTWETFQFEAIGLAINNIVFLRLGELARGIVAARELKISTVSVLATIFVERMCDTAALTALFVVGSLALPELVDARVRMWALVLAAVLVAVLAVLAAAGDWLLGSRWGRRLETRPRLRRVFADLVAGTRALRSWKAAAPVAGLSLGLWICDGTAFWVVARAMDFDPALSFPRSITTLAAAAAGTALPAVPGAFGNFEAAIKLILMHFGYGRALALSYATFLHLVMFAVMTTLGIVFFYRLGHTFSSLRRSLESE